MAQQATGHVCIKLLTFLLILGSHMDILGARGGKRANFTGRDLMPSERMFSMFSIVNFPNLECTTALGDVGTCMKASECSSKDGLVSGSCASGFGSCCLIYNKACGNEILTHNITYLLNPGYPASYSTASTCTWTMEKVSLDICYIRLDFDQLTIANPDTTGNAGTCTTDLFQGSNAKTGTAVASNTKLSPICGINDGQHMYLDAGVNTGNSAVLTATLTGSTNRIWKIKVSQISCSNPTAPPPGCYQYHTGVHGTVRSFNFDQSSANFLHLANQFYKVCIRRESGYCKIAWTQSSDIDSFKVSRPAPNYNSGTGQAGCGPDSILIAHGSNNGEGGCTTPGPVTNPYVDRYCGGTLSCNFNSKSPQRIITDRVPFEMEVNFNSLDTAGTANRGFCLNYAQMQCLF